MAMTNCGQLSVAVCSYLLGLSGLGLLVFGLFTIVTREPTLWSFVFIGVAIYVMLVGMAGYWSLSVHVACKVLFLVMLFVLIALEITLVVALWLFLDPTIQRFAEFNQELADFLSRHRDLVLCSLSAVVLVQLLLLAYLSCRARQRQRPAGGRPDGRQRGVSIARRPKPARRERDVDVGAGAPLLSQPNNRANAPSPQPPLLNASSFSARANAPSAPPLTPSNERKSAYPSAFQANDGDRWGDDAVEGRPKSAYERDAADPPPTYGNASVPPPPYCYGAPTEENPRPSAPAPPPSDDDPFGINNKW